MCTEIVGPSWLNPEVLSLFLFHQMPALTQEQEMYIMQQKVFLIKGNVMFDATSIYVILFVYQ